VFGFIGDVVATNVKNAQKVIGIFVGEAKIAFGIIGDVVTNVGNVFGSVFGAIGGFVSNAFNTAVGVVRGGVNTIIGLVNTVIGAIDGVHLKVPDWIPVIGGQNIGFNIPKFPMLAHGSNDSPDTFIAGENGPEIVTGRPHSTVYDAQRTAGMMGGKATHYHFAPGSIILDPKSVKNFADVVDMIGAVAQTARGGKAA